MLHAFLNHPKTFAYAGFVAMIPKCLISLSIGITLSMLAGENACLSFLILSYPFVAFMVDGLLYGLRNRLWKPLSPNKLIPPEWEIEAAELEQYARNLPKVRLMRLATIAVLMLIFALPIAKEKNFLIALFTGFWIFFFASVLFDPIWRRALKIKKPKIFNLGTAGNDAVKNFEMDNFDDSDPTVPGSIAWDNAQMDPTIPGTPAWLIQRE